jgi:hypothetical protein
LILGFCQQFGAAINVTATVRNSVGFINFDAFGCSGESWQAPNEKKIRDG